MAALTVAVTGPSTVRVLTRRYVLLVALHWFPVGLTVPVMVLLMQARGLSLAQVGLAFSVYGALSIALELPTGGLADVVGRRPVLVVAAGLHVLSCGAFVVAGGVPGFLAAFALMAVGRALFSGPLEAWYVDAVHAVECGADVTAGLSRGGAADAGSLAVAAAIGGALPSLLGSLAAPFVVSAVLDLLYLASVLRLVTAVRPPREGSLGRALRQGVRDVPATVGGALRLTRTDGPLRLVLAVTAVGGAGLVAFELLGPVRFAELTGGPEQGAAVLGTVQAVSFGAAAVGALAAPRLRRLLRGSTRAAAALTAVVGAAGLIGFAGADAVVSAAAGVTVYYIGHAAQWPLLSAVLHGRVAAAQRATAVSALSLAVAVGGVAASLGLPLLVGASSTQVAAAVVGGVVLLSGLLCLRLPSAGDQEHLLDDGKPVLPQPDEAPLLTPAASSPLLEQPPGRT